MHSSDPSDLHPAEPSESDAATQGAVRTLLADQPDPGRMPATVVNRVEAALAQAATRRAADDQLFDELGFGEPSEAPEEQPESIRFDRDAAASGQGDRAVPFVRRRWPVLAAAAAAAVLLGGGAVVGLVQVRRSAEAIAAIPGANATPFAGSSHVQVSNAAYTKATLPTAARALVTKPGPEASSGDAPSVGPLATSSGLASCISGLKQSDATAVTVDLATYEGSPAAILVVRKDEADTAYVVERDCSNADPGIIQDAVPVP